MACGLTCMEWGILKGYIKFAGTNNEDVTEFVRMGQQMLFIKLKMNRQRPT